MEIGISKPGKDSIEGLLPDKVIAAVFSRETDLVMQLGSQKSQERREAKRNLKRKLLEEFRCGGKYSDSELKRFIEIWTNL